MKPWKSTMTREYHAAYRAANYESITAKRLEIKNNNPEKYAKMLKRGVAWHANNLEKSRESHRKYKAMKRLDPVWREATNARQRELYAAKKKREALCGANGVQCENA